MFAEALVCAKDADLDARPAPAKWTAREAAHHLADSEMTSAVRRRLLLAVDGASIAGYDQDEFARRLHYDRPIEASLEAFKAARRTTAEILDRMTDQEWQRAGTDSEHGRYSVERWSRFTPPTRTSTPSRFSSRGTPRKSDNRRDRSARRAERSAIFCVLCG